MNYLLARIRDRRNGMRCILSNQEIYASPDTLNSAVPYTPEDALDDGEWYFLGGFSQRSYCLDILKIPFNGTAYAAIADDEFHIISFLCSFQDDGLIYFQRVSKNQLLRQKRVVFSDSVKFEEDSKTIIINHVPDAIYRASDNQLFFQKLSSITSIFPGIDEIFREATAEETNLFLASDFVSMGDSFDCSCVKKPNLKRIALAKEALDGYDTDEDLTYLLYGILQRYYTTADGREKRIASATRKL